MISFSITAEVIDVYVREAGWSIELQTPVRAHGIARVELKKRDGDRRDCLDLRATAEFDFGDTEQLFVDLDNGFLPAGSSLEKDDLFGGGVDVFDPPAPGSIRLEELPNWVLPRIMGQMRELAREQLASAAIRAVGVVRWRYGIPGPPQPLKAVKITWSINGDKWHRWHPTTSAKMLVSVAVPGDVDQNAVQALLDVSEGEPLHHALLREAQAAGDAYPRSAVLIAVSAAEIGVKAFIADRAPDAAWLAFEAPSPPLTKIVQKYLPLIDGDPHVRGRSIRIPAAVFKPLERAVPLRNRIAHKDAAESEAAEKLQECLSAVSDLLWLLDAARGHQWAMNNVSFEALEELGFIDPNPTIAR